MNLLKEAAKCIGWLAGSIAGISAILGAFGFIIHRSQMHLLGLDAFMEFDTEFYVQEGAKFIVVLWSLAQKSFLPFLIIIVLFFLPVFFSVHVRSQTFRTLLESAEKLSGQTALAVEGLHPGCHCPSLALSFDDQVRGFSGSALHPSLVLWGCRYVNRSYCRRNKDIKKMGHPTGNGETH